MTKNGSFIARETRGFCGHVIYVVATLVPAISSTKDFTSSSTTLRMWPFFTYKFKRENISNKNSVIKLVFAITSLFQMDKGELPML